MLSLQESRQVAESWLQHRSFRHWPLLPRFDDWLGAHRYLLSRTGIVNSRSLWSKSQDRGIPMNWSSPVATLNTMLDAEAGCAWLRRRTPPR